MEKDTNNENDHASSHRIISPMLLFTNNKKDIEQLLNTISKKHNVSIKDAAFALTKTLQNYST